MICCTKESQSEFLCKVKKVDIRVIVDKVPVFKAKVGVGQGLGS